MFKDCTTLNECEAIINKCLSGISFLGQVELNEKDVSVLGLLIKNKIKGYLALGLEQIKKHTPACLSIYLVWKGIFGYDRGDFWSSISKELELTDSNLQAKMGRIFLDFIKVKGLDQIEADNAYQYVTPILFHGGIPQSCLPEYFEKVISPIVKSGITDENVIKDYLYTLRIHEKNKIALKRDIKNIRTKIKNLDITLKTLKQKEELYKKFFDTLNHKLEIENRINDIIEYKKDLEKEERVIKGELLISDLVQYIQACKNQLTSLKMINEQMDKTSQQLSCYRRTLSQLSEKILTCDWNTELMEKISKIDSEIIAEKIDLINKKNKESIKHSHVSFYPILTAIGTIFLLLLISPPHFKFALITGYCLLVCFLYLLKKAKDNRLKRNIKTELDNLSHEVFEILKGIPVKKGILDSNISLPQILHKIKIVYREYRAKLGVYRQINNDLEQCKNTINKIASSLLSDDTDIKEPITDMTNLNSIIKTTEKVLKNKEKVANELDPELERLICLRNNDENQLHNLRATLFNNQDTDLSEDKIFGYLNNGEQYSSYIERIYKKIRELKSLIQRKERQLSQYSQSIGLVDEPVFRFIVFGGNWAEQILVSSVKLMTKTMDEGQAMAVLPERIEKAFHQWRMSNDSDNNELDVKLRQSNCERKVIKPELMYDIETGGVKVFISSQQISVIENTNSYVCVNIHYEDPTAEAQQIQLQAYRNRGLLHLVPAELYLNHLFGQVTISLIIGDEIYKWDFELITEEQPYLVFSDKGRYIDTTELPGKLVYLVLWNRYELSDNTIVIEESVTGRNEDHTTVFLIDLYGEKLLQLKGADGSELAANISGSGYFEPYLEGGEIAAGITFDGHKIYNKKPEYLIIPYEKGSFHNWSCTVRYCNDSAGRQHYILQNLVDTERVADCDKIAIPLYSSGLLEEGCHGRYTISLFYRNRKILIYEINIIPGLCVLHQHDNFLMPLKPDQPIQFYISIPKKASIKLKGPGVIVNRNANTYCIMLKSEDITSSDEGVVRGDFEMELSNGITFKTPVFIEPPVLKWRINGLSGFDNWNCYIRQLWIEDLNVNENIELELYHPYYNLRFARVYINRYTQYRNLSIKNNTAYTDIKCFYDTLKAGENLEKVYADVYIEPEEPPITVKSEQQLTQHQSRHISTFDTANSFIDSNSKENKVYKTGVILEVQCVWEVTNLKYTVKDNKNKRKIVFSWNEKGRNDDRLIKIWKAWCTYERPLCFAIPYNTYTYTIETDKVQMPDGDYIVNFASPEPWIGDKQDLDLPPGRFNVFSFTISDGKPYIKRWTTNWTGQNKLNIKGFIENAKAQYEIAVSVYGLHRGKELCFTARTLSMPDGSFNIYINNNREGIILKNIAYWIGFTYEDKGRYYEYFILPNRGSLEWKLTDEIAKYFIKGNIAYRIIVVTVEGRLETHMLSDNASQKVVQCFINKKSDSIRISKRSKANLSYKADLDKFYMGVEKGVKCCTCGLILSSQREWFRHAHINHCKGLNPNFTKVEAILFITPLYKEDNKSILLYSSRCFPFPGQNNDINSDSAGQITKLLWKREQELHYGTNQLYKTLDSNSLG